MPEEPKDIFSFGFNNFLYKIKEEIKNPLIYDAVKDLLNPELLDWGKLAIGKDNAIFKVTDEGIQLGNKDFLSAPFAVDMDGSVKIGIGTNTQILWDNTNLTIKGDIKPTTQVSDTLVVSADVNSGVTETVYTLKKQITFQASGTLRIKFDIDPPSGGAGADTIYGRIYRNDAAVGTERTVQQPTGNTNFSEDIGGWSVADKVQLYCKVNGGAAASTQNFRIYTSIIGATIDTN